MGQQRSGNDRASAAQTMWEPREIEATDIIGDGPLRRLAALLDRGDVTTDRTVPPLGHWLYFLPETPQSELGDDGHPRRGALLPGSAASRRMWAGGRVDFLFALPIGVSATKRSKVVAVETKHGHTGPLTFVTVRHEIATDRGLAIVEEQDLVYLDASSSATPSPMPDLRGSAATRRVAADSRALFRFSALTNNAHRIHYDSDYAVNEEGYPGLVVHGPFQAILLGHVDKGQPQRN